MRRHSAEHATGFENFAFSIDGANAFLNLVDKHVADRRAVLEKLKVCTQVSVAPSLIASSQRTHEQAAAGKNTTCEELRAKLAQLREAIRQKELQLVSHQLKYGCDPSSSFLQSKNTSKQSELQRKVDEMQASLSSQEHLEGTIGKLVTILIKRVRVQRESIFSER